MKSKLTIIGVFFAQLLVGQTFTESTTTQPFQAVLNGVTAIADIDGDGDQDVLIAGSIGFPNGVTKLYTNDGAGNFSEVPNVPFEQLEEGLAAFSDVDGDGDQDLLLTGRLSNLTYTGGLYLNDGQGNFTKDPDSPIINMAFGEINFADIDNDGDEDFFINGALSLSEIVAKLYTNDGQGNFTEVPDTPFAPISDASAFADIDNDGDLDIALAGTPADGGTRLVKLYTNDGQGNYSEVPGTNFTGVAQCDLAFSDVDGDGDQDMVVLGHTNAYVGSTKLYKNNGGTFTAAPAPFQNLSVGEIAFADLDDDGFEELLITGIDNNYVSYTQLFKNNAGTFSLVDDTPFAQLGFASVGFADFDGDNDEDVIMSGTTGTEEVAGLYFNQFMVSGTAAPSLSPADFECHIIQPVTSNSLAVSLVSQKNQAVYLSVFDVQGQRILGPLQKQMGVGQHNYSLELPDMGKGLYFLHVRGNAKMATERFVKQ
ncbi:MAG TPA: FG-GAP-like repeat-containing protein [Saprospiraceae bacterium]|nr:FG-GAP-like repeat-containing protein [Saprospiraceae bacterium]HMQ82865.1 FG-GAP-like repeat-containing protein [Saprospiraceae bacterium]